MKNDWSFLICARCDHDMEADLYRAYEDGGPEQCSQCGLAIPQPPDDWMLVNGYDLNDTKYDIWFFDGHYHESQDHIVTARSAYEACEEMEAAWTDWIEGGDWDLEDGPTHITGHIKASHVGRYSDTDTDTRIISLTLPQDEPACVEDSQHSWTSPPNIVGGCAENPGVYRDDVS